MNDKLITIATYSYSRAQLLKSCLEAEKIDCFMTNTNMIQSAVSLGVKVYVRETDMEKALEIVDAFNLKFAKENIENSNIAKVDIKRILVPIDFNHDSKNICEYALALAKNFSSEIMLFHAYYGVAIESIPFSDTYTTQTRLFEILDDIEQESTKKVKKIIQNLNSNLTNQNINNVDIKYTLCNGIIESEIINICNSYKPDIIVMGKKDSTNDNEIFGEVSETIVKKSKVPVLLVPKNADFKGLENLKNIMYATTFDKSDFRALAKLKHFTSPFKMSMHCVHFDNKDLNPWKDYNMNILERYLHKNFKNDKVICTNINFENKITEIIENFISKNNIDLIAYTSKKKSFISRLLGSSFSNKIFGNNNLPLLVFHHIQ